MFLKVQVLQDLSAADRQKIWEAIQHIEVQKLGFLLGVCVVCGIFYRVFVCL